jgi:hypothetical protein
MEPAARGSWPVDREPLRRRTCQAAGLAIKYSSGPRVCRVCASSDWQRASDQGWAASGSV